MIVISRVAPLPPAPLLAARVALLPAPLPAPLMAATVAPLPAPLPLSAPPMEVQKQ